MCITNFLNYAFKEENKQDGNFKALINRDPELLFVNYHFKEHKNPSSSPWAPSFQEREACDETETLWTNHDPITYSLRVGEGVTPQLGACAAGLG